MKNELLEKYYEQINKNSNDSFQFYDVYEVTMSSHSSSSSCGACCCCLILAYAVTNGC